MKLFRSSTPKVSKKNRPAHDSIPKMLHQWVSFLSELSVSALINGYFHLFVVIVIVVNKSL